MGADLSFAVEFDNTCVCYCPRILRMMALDDALRAAGRPCDPKTLQERTRDFYDHHAHGCVDPPYWLREMTAAEFFAFIDKCDAGPVPTYDDEMETIAIPVEMRAISLFATRLDGRVLIWYGP